jgi:DNA-binding beta-propeller fold protein YncE
VGSFTPEAIQVHPSALKRVWRFITGPPEPDHMRNPYGVAASTDGELFVTDAAGGTLHVFDVRKRAYRRLEVDAQSLVGVATRGDRIYLSDAVGAAVICIDRRGRRLWKTSRGAFQRPTGIVATATRLYVVDTLAGHVAELGDLGNVIAEIGTRGTGNAQFNYPTTITAGRDGTIYVTDTLNFRVQAIAANGRFLRTFGRLGDGSGDFNRPKGVASDSDGNVHVVEGLNDVVQVFSPEGRFLLAYGESGTGPGQLWLPTGITIADDKVYVADTANRRVQVYQYLKERQ